MREYKPPVNVSPLIKFGRWSFLLVGIAYGASKHSILQRREDSMREAKQKQREAKAARLAEEKKIASALELQGLAKMAGVEKL